MDVKYVFIANNCNVPLNLGVRDILPINRYKYVVFPDGNILHQTTRDAIKIMMCSKQSDNSLSN